MKSDSFILFIAFYLFVVILIIAYNIYLWRKGQSQKRELKSKEDVLFFKDVELFLISKRWMLFNGSFPTKVDVIITNHKVHFFPGKYRLGLFSNPVPGSISVKCSGLKFKSAFSKTIIFDFPEACLYSENHLVYLSLLTYECSLTFENVEQRDGAFRKLNSIKEQA